MAHRGNICIAIAEVENCANLPIQGFHYHTADRCRSVAVGPMRNALGDYLPAGVKVVAAFDVDAGKVAIGAHRAIFSKPDCTEIFQDDTPDSSMTVRMGPMLDGLWEHMTDYEGGSYIGSGAREMTRTAAFTGMRTTQAPALMKASAVL